MNALEYLMFANILDKRQQSKIKHKLNEIIGIAFFALLANADDFQKIVVFGKHYEEDLREYFELENGIPSHDTFVC